jgi:photosystem I P700 chlorophyll a apoprotein A2
MATKLFPKFAKVQRSDYTSNLVWTAAAHDFESHDGMTEENLYQDFCVTLWSISNYFLMDIW